MPATLPTSKIIKKWQSILRLSDWKISSRWVGQKAFAEIIDGDSCAGVTADTEQLHSKTAIIWLIRGRYSTQEELETDIVHELIHVLLWPITKAKPTKTEELLLEQVVVTLEKALCPKREKNLSQAQPNQERQNINS